MGLEAASYIDELDELNPTFEDFLAEGDDHIRAVKRTLKATLPGLAGRAWRKRSMDASGPLTRTDNTVLVVADGGITLTPNDASVLGNGWMTFVRANGGTVVINPTQNINGGAQVSVPAGYTSILMSDGVEFFSMLVYQDVPPAVQAFTSGTKMVFVQTTAPTGWTKLTSSIYNNAALRMTTGVAASGGIDEFTTTFGSGKATAGHTLTLTQIPSHAHSYTRNTGVNNLSINDIPGYVLQGGDTTGAAGGGGSHTHGLNDMNIKYVDMITASKD